MENVLGKKSVRMPTWISPTLRSQGCDQSQLGQGWPVWRLSFKALLVTFGARQKLLAQEGETDAIRIRNNYDFTCFKWGSREINIFWEFARLHPRQTSISNPRQQIHITVPCGQIIFVELAQVVMPAGARHHLHQLGGGG
jgi:hypothetical protein